MNKANIAKNQLSVLVARPAEKGLALVHQLTAHNIPAAHCALFSYQLVDDIKPCQQQLLKHKNDILIFVSPHAVKFAAKLLSQTQWCYQDVIAIGKATKQALTALGIQAISPEIETSEGLLSLDLLQAKNVANKQIVIVRGDKGRELIFDTLIDRKANISYAKSYQRQWHNTHQDKYGESWLKQSINCIVVTSVAILEAMLSFVKSNNAIHWIVASERIAQRAIALGITHVINVNSANNQNLLNTIIDLNNSLLETNNDR